jgi:hypothetical protein
MESTGLTFRGVGQECESEAMCTLCLEQDNHMVHSVERAMTGLTANLRRAVDVHTPIKRPF